MNSKEASEVLVLGSKYPEKLAQVRDDKIQECIKKAEFSAVMAFLDRYPGAIDYDEVKDRIFDNPVQFLSFIKKYPSILDKLPHDTIIEIANATNIYKSTANGEDQGRLLFSFTNYAEEYLKRMTAVSMVGFLSRMIKEFNVYDVDYSTTLFSNKELGLPVPKRVIHDTGEVVGDVEMSRDEMRKKNLACKELLMNFFKHHFEFDPEKHICTSYVEMLGTDGLPLDRRRSKDRPKLDIPFETFHRWKNYHVGNYDRITCLTKDLYPEAPYNEFAISPYKIIKCANGKEYNKEIYKFKKLHAKDIAVSIYDVDVGHWTFLDHQSENRKRTKISGNRGDLLERMIEYQKEAEKLHQDLLNKRKDTMTKKSEEKHGAIKSKIKDYVNTRDNKHEVHIYENPETIPGDGPEDAIEVGMLVVDSDPMTGESTLTKKVFYSECKDPEEDEIQIIG